MFFNSSYKLKEHVLFLVQSKALCELIWAEAAVNVIKKNTFFNFTNQKNMFLLCY